MSIPALALTVLLAFLPESSPPVSCVPAPAPGGIEPTRVTGLMEVSGMPGVSGMAAVSPDPHLDTLPDPLLSPTEAEAEPLTEDRRQTDEEVRQELQALFNRIRTLQNVEVAVDGGVVFLTGSTLSGEARDEAEELARGTEGVRYVENRIQEATSLEERLGPSLERARTEIVDFLAWLPLLIVGLGIVAGFVALGSLAARWEGPHIRALTPNPFLRNLIRQGLRAGTIVLGVLLALELLDATALVGAVIGVAGIFGLALGFAFRDVVENYLAGVILSIRQPFAPNDHIVVEGQEGKVIRLTARDTILMTLAGNHVRIPNASVFRSTILNYTRNPRRRFDFQVSVGPDQNLVEAQNVARRTLEGMDGVLADPGPSARVTELGDSWVTLRASGWVDQTSTDFGRVRSRAIRLVKEALEGAGVSMPSPEYRVILDRDGPRTVPEGAEEPLPDAPSHPREVSDEDISVDTSLDEQIAEDRRLSGEEDLLEGPPSSGS